jgi:hypothetical protein
MNARKLSTVMGCRKLNPVSVLDVAERENAIRELLGSTENSVWIGPNTLITTINHPLALWSQKMCRSNTILISVIPYTYQSILPVL